ncbi:hypothetical protein FRB95_003029 [Tulasnella sp. JGI-2019a]|nr:hypothetical protein FRB95_003029 [Tulasnella sp. JGI-2019a]
MIAAYFFAPLLAVSVVAGPLLNQFQRRAGIVFPTECATACASANKTLSSNPGLSDVCTSAFEKSLVACLECSLAYGGESSEVANLQADEQTLASLQAQCASNSISLPAATITSIVSFPSVSATSSAVSSSSVSSAPVSSVTSAASVASTSAVGGGFATSTSAAAAATTSTKSGDTRMEPSVMAAWGMGLAVMGVFLMS